MTRDPALDETLTETFPASDAPSALPNADGDALLRDEQVSKPSSVSVLLREPSPESFSKGAPSTGDPIATAASAKLGGKKGQGPTAALAFLAFLAMWFV
jgi:hypothetical protein